MIYATFDVDTAVKRAGLVSDVIAWVIEWEGMMINSYAYTSIVIIVIIDA